MAEIAQLRATPVFRSLPKRMKTLMENYLSNGGDKLAAIRATYPACSEKSLRAMAHAYFKKPRIVECLAATGVETECAGDARQKFHVGDIVIQEGKRYRITAEELEQ